MKNIEKFFRLNNSILKIGLVILFIISSLIFLRSLTLDFYPDFSVYYYGTLTYLQGGNPYIEGDKYFAPFVYPPTSLLFFSTFTILPFLIAQKIFAIFSIISLFLSIYLLFKLFKIKIFSLLGVFIFILVLNFFPAKFTLGMGQVNNLILLLTTLFIYLYINNKKKLSGVFLGLAFSLKFFPVLLIPYLIIKKEWKVLLIFSITFLAIAISAYFLVDQDINRYYIQVILPSLISGEKIDYYNQAFSGFLNRSLGSYENLEIFKNLISVIVIIGTYIWIWSLKKFDKITELLIIGSLITLNLIFNSFSWQHHFVWILIPMIITLFYIKEKKLNIKYYLFLGISYFLIALNLKDPSSFPVIAQSHVLYGSILLYILNVYILFRGK